MLTRKTQLQVAPAVQNGPLFGYARHRLFSKIKPEKVGHPRSIRRVKGLPPAPANFITWEAASGPCLLPTTSSIALAAASLSVDP